MAALNTVTFVAFALLLLAWLGYPAVLLVWSSIRRRPIEPDPSAGARTHVSVVLATREQATVVRERVANLLDSEHPRDRLDVVVALDPTGLADRDVLAGLGSLGQQVTVVVGDAPGGKAATLNAGVRAARGSVVVLADAQQRFDRRTIPELAGAMADQRFGAVSGALTLGGSGSPVHAYWTLEKWIRHREALVSSTIGVTGAVYAVRRALWPEIPSGTLLDDVYVPMSIVLGGARVGFIREAKAMDVRTFDAAAEGARKSRTSTGLLQLRRLLPGAFDPRRNPVWWQLAWHKYARLMTPILAPIVVLGAGVQYVQWALTRPVTGLAPLALLSLVLLARPRSRHVARNLTAWGIAMPAAVARGLLHGARGQFEVWKRPK